MIINNGEEFSRAMLCCRVSHNELDEAVVVEQDLLEWSAADAARFAAT